MEAVKTRMVDFHRIKDEHAEIDARMNNWRRWVSVRSHGWHTHPMWRNVLTSRQWDTDPHINTTVDTLDAMLIERTVSQLPHKHREAVRWHYVGGHDVIGMARALGVSRHGLYEMVCDALTMVQNRAGRHNAGSQQGVAA